MRAVAQRVKGARVEVDGRITGSIETGLMVFLGVGGDDDLADGEFMADKLANLRIFGDDEDRMNLSVKDAGGAILLISQFTLYGDCRKGRRPSFDAAAEPEQAKKLYEDTIALIRAKGVAVETGIFAARMQVFSQNDGPVTFILDSKKKF
ncbi:MAG: D-tyrosyl-tRNA(Tyr) deacylase [Planctomycetota bacterium]|nr:MAG: D-tyrosyl-tRNA(Tyr) deacylase [Planctomycetota bacterium]